MSETGEAAAPEPQTGAAAIANAEPAPAPKQPEGDAPWYASIQDEELRGVAENCQWASPEDSVKSYRNLEKLLGVPEDQLMRLPQDGDYTEVFNRLGKPSSATDYEVDLGDDTDAFRTFFHQANLTSDQAKALAENYNTYISQVEEQAAKDIEQQSQAALNELKGELGGQFDRLLGDVRRGVQNLNMSDEELNMMEAAFGTKRMYEILGKVGPLFAEADGPNNTMSSHNGFGGMSPEAARSEIQLLKKDTEFMGKLLGNDQKSRDRWAALHRNAYPK